MFWRYFLFEAKLLIHNRKNWLLGIVLLLFFPIFILYTNQAPSESLRDIKREEADNIRMFFKVYANDFIDGTPDQQLAYENIIQQSTLVNFQVYYIRSGKVTEDYIENGLKLNEFRLALHKSGNKGLPDYMITSEEDILKENALLKFIQEEKIELDANAFLAEHHFVIALSMLSGLPFVFFILLSGSEIIVYERRHQTVMSGFPISFMNKINVKVFINFVHTMVFLVLGLLLGNYFLSRELGTSSLTDPIVIFNNGSYEAIIMFHYLLYVLVAMAVITILVLYLSIFLNVLFKNAYANVLVGFGLFLLPYVVLVKGISISFLHPLKYIEFTKVLSGTMANELKNNRVDFGYGMIWLIGLCAILIGVLFVKNKLSYKRGK